MKFLHYAALIIGASALTLEQMNQQAAPVSVGMAPPQTLELQITEGLSKGPPSKKQIKELIKTLRNDIKDNGPMAPPRFYDILKAWFKENDIEKPQNVKTGWMRRIFKWIDKNDDGKISKDEFNKAVGNASD